MADDERPAPPVVNCNFTLNVSGNEIGGSISLPNAPVALSEMLPIFQTLADAVTSVSASAAEEQGKRISCTKGCGACCRQLVPLAEVEARRLAQVVEDLPEPRRSAVRERFAAAVRRMDEAGLLARLRDSEHAVDGHEKALGMAYFEQGVACPFLENESCSIYADRPLICREYQVTSPPEFCAHPTAGTIESVQLPVRVWSSVAEFDPTPDERTTIRWVPLILALEWAQDHPDESTSISAPEILRTLLERLSRKKSAQRPLYTPSTSPTAAPD